MGHEEEEEEEEEEEKADVGALLGGRGDGERGGGERHVRCGCPGKAVDLFVRALMRSVRILSVGYQVALEKV